MSEHEDFMERLETVDLVPIPVAPPTPPSALSLATIEEAIRRAELCASVEWPGDFARQILFLAQQTFTPTDDDAYRKRGVEIRDLRQALARQAQEIERQHQDFERATAKVMELRQLLAAMTAERDSEKERCRLAMQIIIETIGSCGPESLESALGRMVGQLAVSQARVRELENATPSMYPIMRGPSVPWEVMRPHESWAQKNHSQSLQQIANRGGLSPGEAWCVVNGIHCGIASKEQWTLWDAEWFKYAERVNLHYAQIATLQARLTASEAENFKLAAGQCVVDGGLVGGEGGGAYCTLKVKRKWTTARPTVAGWYWVQWPDDPGLGAEILEVTQPHGPDTDYLEVNDTPMDEYLAEYPSVEWQGPLTPGE